MSKDVDKRLGANSEDSLIASFKNLQLSPLELPLRPNFGKAGRAIKLRANFFPVTLPNRPLFEYEVVITPASAARSARQKRRVFDLAEETSDWRTQGLKDKVAHDHASKLVAPHQLAQPLTIKLIYFEEDEEGPSKDSQEVTLNIQYARQLDTAGLHKWV